MAMEPPKKRKFIASLPTVTSSDFILGQSTTSIGDSVALDLHDGATVPGRGRFDPVNPGGTVNNKSSKDDARNSTDHQKQTTNYYNPKKGHYVTQLETRFHSTNHAKVATPADSPTNRKRPASVESESDLASDAAQGFEATSTMCDQQNVVSSGVEERALIGLAMSTQQNVVSSGLGAGPGGAAKAQLNHALQGEDCQIMKSGAERRNRRKYSIDFKVSVLDGYYKDPETKMNQRKTAIKYGVNRRQIQKWLAQEDMLRNGLAVSCSQNKNDQNVATAKNCGTLLNANNSVPPSVGHSDRRLPSPPGGLLTPVKSVPADLTSGMSSRPNFSARNPLIATTASSRVELENLFITQAPFGPVCLKTSPRTLSSVKSEIDDLSSTDGYSHSDQVQDSYDEMDELKPMDLCKSKSKDPVDGVTQANWNIMAAKARTHPDPVSSHVLDTALGVPAADIQVSLYRMYGGSAEQPGWMKISGKTTNSDGRASDFVSWENFHPGTYKMYFNTGPYFAKTNRQSFYPYVEVVFEIRDPTAHYHVPLLLSPYGYSTYRGS